MRWCADAWRIPREACFAAGDVGNDAELLAAAAGAILVANHDDDLRHLRDAPHVYASRQRFADGVLDGLMWFLPEGGNADIAAGPAGRRHDAPIGVVAAVAVAP